MAKKLSGGRKPGSGRPRQAFVKRPTVIRTGEADDQPAVWISQLKDGVNYGVRDYGKPGKRTTARAQAEFLRVKHFVEVELPQIEEANKRERELLEKSAAEEKE